jgi:hypothetical protein
MLIGLRIWEDNFSLLLIGSTEFCFSERFLEIHLDECKQAVNAVEVKKFGNTFKPSSLTRPYLLGPIDA